MRQAAYPGAATTLTVKAAASSVVEVRLATSHFTDIKIDKTRLPPPPGKEEDCLFLFVKIFKPGGGKKNISKNFPVCWISWSRSRCLQGQALYICCIAKTPFLKGGGEACALTSSLTTSRSKAAKGEKGVLETPPMASQGSWVGKIGLHVGRLNGMSS